MRSCIVILALVLFLWLGVVIHAQEAIVEPISPAKSTDSKDLYDIDASGTDIKFVLEALARRSGANIVVSPEVTGQVNAHLKQQPLDSILDFLVTCQGFALRKEGSTYLVGPKAKLDPSTSSGSSGGPETRVRAEEEVILVWDCKNVQANHLVSIISKLFPTVNVTEGPGTFLPDYTERPTSATTSTSGSASMSASGSDNSGQGGSVSASGSVSQKTTTSGEFVKNGSKIILIGPPGDIERAKGVLEKLDVRKRQVNIELAFTEFKTSADKQLGMDWTWDPLAVKQGVTLPNPDPLDTSSEFNPTNVTIGQRKFLTQPWNFGATLSLMVKNGTANLLAKPNISVIDGESARIFLGNTVRYLQLDSRDREGRPIYRADSVDAGISLPIAPRVISDDEVMLTLHPAVSLITGYTRIEGSEYPQVSTREVQTTVIVKSGATLAIGGLIHSEDMKNGSKVPIMGDLPIIGNLFKSRTTKTERTELVIFLTPRIMPED